MNRTLRMSSRPFIALGIMFGVLSLFLLYGFLHTGRRAEGFQAAGIMVGSYVLIMALICAVRVRVSDDGILVRRFFVSTQTIQFDDISHSDVQFMAERNWPLAVTIHSRHRQPAIRLGLKAMRQEDAAWLCSLPQLKCVMHPGLTRRA